MIVSRTGDSLLFRNAERSGIKVQADEYGLAITASDPDGLVVYYPLSPSDAEILYQFLGETLPMWDKDEI